MQRKSRSRKHYFRDYGKRYKVDLIFFIMDKVKFFIDGLEKFSDFDRVKFIILYGSQASGKANKMSDYDFAVFYEGGKKERFNFRIRASGNKLLDVQIFQDLPLYVKKEVLKGKVVYAKDDDLSFVGDVAYETIKAFEDFKKYYYDYIGMRKMR